MRYKVRDLAKALVDLTKDAPQERVKVIVDKFVRHLEEIHATALLPRILPAFDAEWLSASGGVQVRLGSASVLTKNIKEKIKAAVPGVAEIEEEVDPTLLGGIRIQVADMLIDATLKRRIKKLEQSLKV